MKQRRDSTWASIFPREWTQRWHKHQTTNRYQRSRSPCSAGLVFNHSEEKVGSSKRYKFHVILMRMDAKLAPTSDNKSIITSKGVLKKLSSSCSAGLIFTLSQKKYESHIEHEKPHAKASQTAHFEPRPKKRHEHIYSKINEKSMKGHITH